MSSGAEDGRDAIRPARLVRFRPGSSPGSSRRSRGLGRRAPADHGAALVAVGLFVAFFAFAGAFHSEHLLADRDPAIYIDTGRSIARTHELKPKIQRGSFTDRVFGTTYGRYRPDFFPMLPVLPGRDLAAPGPRERELSR